MRTGLVFLGSLGLGVGLMYVLDPDRGRRRRALLRDKVRHAVCETEDSLRKAVRDLENRTGGFMHEAQNRFRSEIVTEEILTARLRSRLGHLVSHPRAIQLSQHRGHVSVSGDILASELNGLLSGLLSVKGVDNIDNHLNVHETADIPALQGESRRSSQEYEHWKKRWTPGTRLLAGITGGALAMYGARNRSVIGVTLGSVGMGLLTRSLANTELLELVGNDK